MGSSDRWRDVFGPKNGAHSAFFSIGKHFIDNVERAMIGRASVLWSDTSVLIILPMDRAVVAAMKIQIIGLLAVIGQGLPGNLASRDSASVSERGKKESIDAVALENVEHGIGTLVYKGNRTDLDADHLFRRRLRRGAIRDQCGGGGCCEPRPQEVTAVFHS